MSWNARVGITRSKVFFFVGQGKFIFIVRGGSWRQKFGRRKAVGHSLITTLIDFAPIEHVRGSRADEVQMSHERDNSGVSLYARRDEEPYLINLVNIDASRYLSLWRYPKVESTSRLDVTIDYGKGIPKRLSFVTVFWCHLNIQLFPCVPFVCSYIMPQLMSYQHQMTH